MHHPRVTFPMFVGLEHSFPNWSVYQYRDPRWIGRHGPSLVSMSQQAPKSHQSQLRSATRFQNSARSATTRSVESFQQCRKIPDEPSLGGRLPPSRSPAPKQVGSPRATCRGIVDNAIAHPSAQKRMTGKYMLDVFGGSGFVAKASNHLVLRGYVLDTKFGSKYGVTKSLLLT